MYIFFSLVIPLYFITWSSQATYALSGKIFTPFLPYKIYPIALAFLVPGPFWINLLTIILFYVQAIVFWFYFDMPGIDKVSLGSEPFGTIVFAVVAFLLLFFKYRDKQIITELGRKQANIEFYELLTQIFLSLRDKANTPLQIQKLAITVLKKRCPNEKGILDSLSNATDELESMNKILEHIEPKTLEYFRTNNLMDEEKILHSLELIEKEITDSLSNNMKEQKK